MDRHDAPEPELAHVVAQPAPSHQERALWCDVQAMGLRTLADVRAFSELKRTDRAPLDLPLLAEVS